MSSLVRISEGRGSRNRHVMVSCQRGDRCAEISLLVSYPDGSELSYAPDKSITKLGRFLGNDILLQQDGVSRFHAEIHIDDKGTVSLVDLGSANGTLVGRRRVNGQKEIGMQDKVQIAGFVIALRPLSEPATDLPHNTPTGKTNRKG